MTVTTVTTVTTVIAGRVKRFIEPYKNNPKN